MGAEAAFHLTEMNQTAEARGALHRSRKAGLLVPKTVHKVNLTSERCSALGRASTSSGSRTSHPSSQDAGVSLRGSTTPAKYVCRVALGPTEERQRVQPHFALVAHRESAGRADRATQHFSDQQDGPDLKRQQLTPYSICHVDVGVRLA